MPIALNDEKQVGSIFSSARSTAPTGYLLCNGSAISRTVYKNLFDAIGVTYGNGDGSTTFNLPDLVGAVPRGAGASSGYTQNVTVIMGDKDDDSFQDFQVGGTVSGITYWGNVQNPGNVNSSTSQSGYIRSTYASSFKGLASRIKPQDDGTNGTPRTTNETKMKNLGVNFFIKF